MRYTLTILIIALIKSQIAFCQAHPEWEEMDRKIISIVNNINKQNPKEVESVFSQGKQISKTSLGFGWSRCGGGFTGGYISIRAMFYYFNDSLIYYLISPQLPDDTSMHSRYRSWYYPYFTTLDTLKFQMGNRGFSKITMKPYEFNKEGILSPLREFKEYRKDVSLPLYILDYMSPNSGDGYGWGGGKPPTIFPNRKMFNSIKESLTEDEVFALLFSINPVSRLTAIECAIKRNYSFLNDTAIRCWIEKIYTEIPEIYTLNGCIGTLENSQKLVEKYSKINL